MNRRAIFLTEMGVGAQWKLRRPVLDQAGDAVSLALADAEPADAAVSQPPAVNQPPTSTAHPAAPNLAEPSAPSMLESAWDDAPAAAPMRPVPQHRAEPVVVAPAGPASIPARPAAPAPRPTPPAAPPSDLDDANAWFDDAPTPEPQTQASQQAITTMGWTELRAAITNCTRCELCATRRNAVPGRGAQGARFMAIAAAPSAQDEDQARAITGPAGALLDNMLKAIALSAEDDIYVTNLVKCRPTEDRAPTSAELDACRPYLERELVLTGAAQLMTFGQAAAKGLLNAASRGKVHRYGALPVVATYHPDDLLKRPDDKAKAWADLCLSRASRG